MTNEPIDHSSDVSEETGAVADGPVPLPPGSVVADDLRRLLDLLPDRIRERLLEDPEIGSFLEVILDLGRLPEARFVGREVIPESFHELEFVHRSESANLGGQRGVHGRNEGRFGRLGKLSLGTLGGTGSPNRPGCYLE